jgi:hypothetical protein
LAEDEQKGRSSVGAHPDVGWELLKWVGWAFVAIGLTDLALIWRPLAIGNPDFEFGSVTAMLNGLPLLTIGLVFLAASAAAVGATFRLRLVGGAMILMALVIVAAGVIYVLAAPLALKSVTGLGLTAVKKAMVKSAVQLVAYPTAYVLLGVKAIRHSFAPRR